MTEWSDLNRELINHASVGNWLSYRNTRLAMADYLRKNRKLLRALTTYLEVSYLDSNGPNNLQDRISKDLAEEAPPFEPSIGMQTARVIGEIYVNAKDLKLDDAQLKTRYLKVASTLQKYIKTPVAPEDGWKELAIELDNYVKGIN
jgi:hypothetical protein